MAGAVFGEGLNVRLGAKCCILQWKMLLGTSKDNLTCEAGCGLRFHARIGPALEMTFHLFSNIFFEILQCHFSWQAQYLVRLDSDTCCSAY